MVNILVVDDNENMRKLLGIHLEKDGFKTYFASDGIEAMKTIDYVLIHLVLADIMMPEMDGYELVKAIRVINSEIPIMFITAKDTYIDKREGFELGADDYMVKPIDFNELRLRIGALLRRAKINSQSKIIVGNIIVDHETTEVRTPDQTFKLPKKEFFLLSKLLSCPGKTFTRQQLLDEIWGLDAFVDDRTVDVHIKRLRYKFDKFEEFRIVTVRGLGYKAEKKA